MDGLIVFFRDILSGPLYIVAVVVAIILIFACIGYLAEKSIDQKKIASQYIEADEVVIDNPVNMTEATTPVSPMNTPFTVPDMAVITPTATPNTVLPTMEPKISPALNPVGEVTMEATSMQSAEFPTVVGAPSPVPVSEVASSIPEMVPNGNIPTMTPPIVGVNDQHVS